MKAVRILCLAVFANFVLCLTACKRNQPIIIDHPRSFSGVEMKDVTFFSQALGRNMPYRVCLPQTIETGKRLPVVYLLHGGNGGFRDWSNDSDAGSYANRVLILVMMEGAFSYYMNAAGKPSERYEDYLTGDLMHGVETRFPAATIRGQRAIIGISMGGFAAIKFALDRPDLFVFAGAFSPPIDILHRRFNIRRTGEWMRIRSIFGTMGKRITSSARSVGSGSMCRPFESKCSSASFVGQVRSPSRVPNRPSVSYPLRFCRSNLPHAGCPRSRF
jgi:enterochelin esterase-like enzyme